MPELGAVPWRQEEVRIMMRAILDGLGAKAYRLEVGQWQHSTTAAWNVQVHRAHLGVSRADLAEHRSAAVELATRAITDLLRAKLDLCRRALESLTLFGAETGDELHEKTRLLHEFWAVERALEDMR